MISSKYAIIFGDETFMRVPILLYMNLMLFYYFDHFSLFLFSTQTELRIKDFIFDCSTLYILNTQYQYDVYVINVYYMWFEALLKHSTDMFEHLGISESISLRIYIRSFINRL